MVGPADNEVVDATTMGSAPEVVRDFENSDQPRVGGGGGGDSGGGGDGLNGRGGRGRGGRSDGGGGSATAATPCMNVAGDTGVRHGKSRDGEGSDDEGGGEETHDDRGFERASERVSE